MNVYPRKPLEAVHRPIFGENPWRIQAKSGHWSYYTDAEFAEHFYPAERLDTLLSLVEVIADSPRVGQLDWWDDIHALPAALRYFQPQEPE